MSRSTAIGNVDSPLQATVDPFGGVTRSTDGWSLGWWVRASDRWHVPAEETGTAVSQRLLGGAPVVETGLRVPGGHVVHRAWATIAGDDEWVVVEVENRSREPVAVAFTLGPAYRIAMRDLGVSVSGYHYLTLPRRPSRVLGAVPEDGGERSWPGDIRARRSDARVAFVFPVAHTARLRVGVALSPIPRNGNVDLATLPPAERVANGWAAHAQPPGSLRLVLPDEGLASSVRAARAALLIDHDHLDATLVDRAGALASLDRYGHHDTVRRALATFADDVRAERWRGAGATLHTLAAHHRLTGEPVPEDLVGPIAEAAHKLRRRGRDDPWTAVGQRAAAELLEWAGQPEAAARCRQLAGPGPLGPPPTASAPAAAELDALHAVLLDDGADALALAPGWPDDWLGRDLEVHEAPTSSGRLSFAVRWHGPRPALLWELDGERGTSTPLRLTAPRLDPSWSSGERRGEALLSPVEPAGGLPGVVAPLGGGTPASAAPEAASWE